MAWHRSSVISTHCQTLRLAIVVICHTPFTGTEHTVRGDTAVAPPLNNTTKLMLSTALRSQIKDAEENKGKGEDKNNRKTFSKFRGEGGLVSIQTSPLERFTHEPDGHR